MEYLLEIRDLYKSYPLPGGGKLSLFENLNFSIPLESSGAVISILAPMNSGKTSLLKIIASIEPPDQGKVFLRQKDYTGQYGRIIYLPETPASYPWLSVKGNLQMALKLSKNQKKLSLKEIIELIGLKGYEDYYPNNDSRGFRFRISLGRALAVDPEIILIDDSFRLMDSITRNEIYNLVKEIKNNIGRTIIVGTTNITEAVTLSDRLIFMKKNPSQIFYDLKLKNDSGKDENYINTLRIEVENIYKKENLSDPLQLII